MGNEQSEGQSVRIRGVRVITPKDTCIGTKPIPDERIKEVLEFCLDFYSKLTRGKTIQNVVSTKQEELKLELKKICETTYHANEIPEIIFRIIFTLYSVCSYESALLFIFSGMKIISDEKTFIKYINLQGRVFDSVGEIKKSLLCFSSQLEFARKIEDSIEEESALICIGGAYQKMKDFQKSLEFYSKSLELSQKRKDIQSEGIILGNIGLLFHQSGDEKKAIEHYQKSLEKKREIGDKHGEILTLNNLGLSYRTLDEISKAFDLHKIACELSRSLGFGKSEADSLINMSIIEEIQENYQGSMDFLNEAKTLYKSLGLDRFVDSVESKIFRLRLLTENENQRLNGGNDGQFMGEFEMKERILDNSTTDT